MADLTPKYSKICFAFMQKIQDPVSYVGGTPTYSYDIAPGKVVQSKAAIEGYINQAMFKLTGMFFEKYEGDIKKVANAFPELVKPKSAITLDGSASYNLETPGDLNNYWQLIDAIVDGKLGSVQPASNLLAVESGENPQYSGDADNPMVVESEKIVKVFPTALFTAKTMKILYLVQPLTTAGAFLTQNGSTDSPFLSHWNDTIASLAAGLWFEDSSR